MLKCNICYEQRSSSHPLTITRTLQKSAPIFLPRPTPLSFPSCAVSPTQVPPPQQSAPMSPLSRVLLTHVSPKHYIPHRGVSPAQCLPLSSQMFPQCPLQVSLQQSAPPTHTHRCPFRTLPSHTGAPPSLALP